MAKIYLIYNTLNNKKYVGETTRTVALRFAEHIASSRTFENKKNSFYEEMFSCGENVFDVFKYKILEECDDKDRFKRELYYISVIKPEYNENGKVYSLYLIKDKIIDEYLNGSNISTLSEKYNCKFQFMSSLLKENGIKINKSRPKYCKKVYMFDDYGKLLKEWNNAGECGAELNIDKSNIRCSCIKNTKNNYLYNSSEGKYFKYTNNTPLDMYEISNDFETIRFKSRNAFVNYFKEKFPDKNIIASQLTRNRKSVYGYTVKVLHNCRKKNRYNNNK